MTTLPPAMSAGLPAVDPELRRRIEECAYSQWETDGRPEGRALEYWLRAEQAISEQPLPDQPVQKRERRKASREPRPAPETRPATG